MSSKLERTLNWEYITLDEVVDRGSSNISLNKIKEDEGEYPIYSAKGFYKNISFYHQEKEYIAIIKDGAGIGRLSVHPPKSSIVGTMQYLIPKDGFDLMFVKYFLTGINFNSYKQGATIPHIYFKDYKVELVPKLPLEEQKRIVAKIDTLFAKIDKAITLTEESLVQAKNLLPSVLNEVFDRLSIKNENVELSNICTFKNGFAFKSKEFNKSGEGNQVIRIGNVLDVQKNQVFIKESPIYNAYLLNENDIIISMTGTRKKKDYLFVRIIKDESSYLNQRVGRISVNSTTHHSYIYYYLKSDMFRSKIFEYETGAVNQGNISGKAIMNMLIPKVDFEEQIEIGAICSNLSEKAKQTQSKLEEQLRYLKQLKSSILSKAFKGEL